MNDDLETIRRVLAADVESLSRLVERYQRPLLTLIRNLTPPDTDHEGVAQGERPDSITRGSLPKPPGSSRPVRGTLMNQFFPL
jgi:hypothetical protein